MMQYIKGGVFVASIIGGLYYKGAIKKMGICAFETTTSSITTMSHLGGFEKGENSETTKQVKIDRSISLLNYIENSTCFGSQSCATAKHIFETNNIRSEVCSHFPTPETSCVQYICGDASEDHSDSL